MRLNQATWITTVAAALVSSLTVLEACSRVEPTTPGDSSAPLRSSITSALAEHLTANGRFDLRPDLTDDRPVLREQEARAIALTAARRTGHMVGRDLERQHGRAISYSQLRDCGRAYFARTPFAALPANLPAEAVFYYGSHWIVPVCAATGVEVISVAIAANAEVTFRGRDDVWGSPGSLSMTGIPERWDGALPIGPESAAILVARETGRRVASVPEFIAPNPGEGFPQGGMWAVQLDGPITIRGRVSGISRQSTELFVSTAQDPTAGRLRGAVGLYTSRPDERRQLEVPVLDAAGPGLRQLQVRPNYHVDLEKVTVQSQDNR